MKKYWLYFSVVWTVFTFSLVAWWWLYAFNSVELTVAEDILKRNRMLFWEGSFLLVTVLVGGFVQMFFIHREHQLNQKLKLFFSNFSHDLKTSISRIRLQADLLREDPNYTHNKTIARIAKEISSLDLLLENSLNVTTLDRYTVMLEPVPLQELINHLNVEFPELSVKINQDLAVRADKRVLISVFRNICENAIKHGKAREVSLDVKVQNDQIIIAIENDGINVTKDLQNLGRELLLRSSVTGYGIGLFISKKLIEKMQGSLHFEIINQRLKQTMVLKKS